MVRRILVPLDGTPLAEQALPLAIEQAKNSQAEVLLLQVLAPRWNTFGLNHRQAQWVMDYAASQARDYLDHLATTLSQANIPVKKAIREGVPHETIVAVAEGHEADLIVMATRTRAGLAALGGSVSARVSQLTDVPVMRVPAGNGKHHPAQPTPAG